MDDSDIRYILKRALVFKELSEIYESKIITAEHYQQLYSMIRSNYDNDVDLAIELIDNLRTKRLRNANRKIKSVKGKV